MEVLQPETPPTNGTDDISMEMSEDYPFLKGDDKLLERVQKALFQQLSEENEKLDLVLRDKEEHYKRMKKERENNGVLLYTQQQELANMQKTLHSLYDSYLSLTQSNTDTTSNLEAIRSDYDKDNQVLQKYRTQLATVSKELQAVTSSIRELEGYNDTMKKEIAVTKRATYKMHSTVKDSEEKKQKQDLLINSLYETFYALQEKFNVLEEQIVSQEREKEIGKEALQDLQNQLEILLQEKKVINQKWVHAVNNIQKKEQALMEIQNQIKQVELDKKTAEITIKTVQNSIREEQENNQKLQLILKKNKEEINNLQTTISTLIRERETLNEHQEIIKKSIAQTDEQHAKLQVTITALENQIRNREELIHKTMIENQDIQKQVATTLNEQASVDRTASTILSSVMKIQESVAKKESELSEIKNELARVRADSLNVEAHKLLLKDRLDEQMKDLNEKKKLIDDCQVEVQRRNLAIEKKELIIDRLNKEYNAKKNSAANSLHQNNASHSNNNGDDSSGTPYGPMEIKIAKLKKEIGDTTNQYLELQQQWTAYQLELIEINEGIEKKTEGEVAVSDEVLVLEHAMKRLEKTKTDLEGEIKSLKKNISSLDIDAEKAATVQLELTKKIKDLEKEISLREATGKKEVEEMEKEWRALDQKIVELRKEKKSVLEEIESIEKAALVLENKITMETELSQVLNSSDSHGEIEMMKKEIGSMEKVVDGLRREKERILNQLENVIKRKGILSSKMTWTSAFDPYNKNSKTNRVQEKKRMEEELVAVKKTVNATSAQLKAISEDIKKKREGVKGAESALVENAGEIRSLQERNEMEKKNLLVQKALHLRTLADSVRFRRASLLFSEVQESVVGRSKGSEMKRGEEGREMEEEVLKIGGKEVKKEEVQGEIVMNKQVSHSLAAAIKSLYHQHENLGPSLSIVLQWLSTISVANDTAYSDDLVEEGEIESTGQTVGDRAARMNVEVQGDVREGEGDVREGEGEERVGGVERVFNSTVVINQDVEEPSDREEESSAAQDTTNVDIDTSMSNLQLNSSPLQEEGDILSLPTGNPVAGRLSLQGEVNLHSEWVHANPSHHDEDIDIDESQ